MDFDIRVLVISGIIWAGVSLAMWSPRYREVYGIGFTILSIIIMFPVVYGIIWFQDNR